MIPIDQTVQSVQSASGSVSSVCGFLTMILVYFDLSCISTTITNPYGNISFRDNIPGVRIARRLEGGHAARLFDACYEVPLAQSADDGAVHLGLCPIVTSQYCSANL